MSKENITINGVKYIRETFPNGSVTTYPDPDFQTAANIPLPQLPPLTTPDEKLDFIIDCLGLKRLFKP